MHRVPTNWAALHQLLHMGIRSVPRRQGPRPLTLRHSSPHALDAWLMAFTMAALRASRSSKVLSSDMRPSSLRIVVCASWLTA